MDQKHAIAALGLAALPANYAAQVNNERSFEEALTARLSGCPSVATARRVAQEVLAAHGRSSWRVAVDQRDRYSGPCTNTFAVDQSNGRPIDSLFRGGIILRSSLLRVSLAKSTSAPLRF